MARKPTSDARLWELLRDAWNRMTPPQRKLWEAIRIPPEIWQEHTEGEASGGFWAVAVVGCTVVWYNHLEYGFNRSHYAQYGTIDGYWSNQDDLEQTVAAILTLIETGCDIWSPSGSQLSEE
jgi:hypothetical protein